MLPGSDTVARARIVPAETDGDFDRLRKILVSPTINTPRHFEGFGGFCGWPKVCLLRNGDLFVAFGAGYWHASWPTPFNSPPAYIRQLTAAKNRIWLRKWHAPEGGRIMSIRSRDGGRTWSRPKRVSWVRGVYGPSAMIQTRDGTMYIAGVVQSWYGYTMPDTPVEMAQTVARMGHPMHSAIFRSEDGGLSWRVVSRVTGPFLVDGRVQDFAEAPDGALLALTDGYNVAPRGDWKYRHFVSALVRSRDRGETWATVGVAGSNDFDTEEGAIAVLPDGSIGFASRPTSAWYQSRDGGKTWSRPRKLFPGAGVVFKKGDHVVTPDGVNAVLHCGGPGGSGQLIYSRNSGRTWVKPAPDRGFKFDPMAYYPDACVLGDGTIFAVGDHQGFANRFGPYGAEVTAMRFRIKTPQEGEGLQLLPIGDGKSSPRRKAAKASRDAAAKADRALEAKPQASRSPRAAGRGVGPVDSLRTGR